MGKEKKAPQMPGAAPQVKKPEVPAVPTEQQKIINYAGMDINSTVTALERIGKMVYDNPNAKSQFNLTDEQVSAYNEFVLSGMTTALVVDIVAKKSKWSITMNEAQLEVVKRVASDIGVTFDTKCLPAPDENGNVVVEMNAETIKVSKETEEAAKREVAAAETAVNLDPTKFQNEEDLAKALDHIIVSEKGAFLKFTRTSSLLRAYKLLKAGDDKKEKETINAMSVGELLNEVFKILSNSKSITHMPIIFGGFGKFIYRETSQAMSPVLAFIKLRDASKNQTTGEPSVDDNTLVGILRVLVDYCAKCEIKTQQDRIAEHEKNLAAVSKDKKKNAEAIKDIESRIAICKKNIEHFEDVIKVTYEPTSEFADNFLEDYSDINSENYRRARQAFKYVTQSFYGDDLTKEANQDHMRKNVQQHIGIITNLFRPAANQFDQFSSSRLIKIEPIKIEEPEKN